MTTLLNQNFRIMSFWILFSTYFSKFFSFFIFNENSNSYFIHNIVNFYFTLLSVKHKPNRFVWKLHILKLFLIWLYYFSSSKLLVNNYTELIYKRDYEFIYKRDYDYSFNSILQ